MATDGKTITVESSPTDVLASLTTEQRRTWREKGDLPEPKEKEAPPAEKPEKAEVKTEDAASSPAAKTEVAETKTESAAVTAESSTSRGKNAETRIKELLADNKRLSSELEAARKQPAASTTKKAEEIVKPRRNDVDEKTGQAKYASDDEFLDARDKYVAEMASKQTRADIAKEEGEWRVAEQNRLQLEKWNNNLKIGMETYADFKKVCEMDDKGAFQSAELKSIRANSMVDAWLLDSSFGGLMLYYFAKNKGEVARIEAMNSFAAARELTRIEEELSGKRFTTNVTEKTEKKEEGSQPQVTKAPAPSTATGGKATAPVDPSEAALNRGDFREYRRLENEKERLRKKAS